jgi:hypothetical protein
LDIEKSVRLASVASAAGNARTVLKDQERKKYQAMMFARMVAQSPTGLPCNFGKQACVKKCFAAYDSEAKLPGDHAVRTSTFADKYNFERFTESDLKRLQNYHWGMPFVTGQHDDWSDSLMNGFKGLSLGWRNENFKQIHISAGLTPTAGVGHGAEAGAAALKLNFKKNFNMDLHELVLRWLSDTASAALKTSVLLRDLQKFIDTETAKTELDQHEYLSVLREFQDLVLCIRCNLHRLNLPQAHAIGLVEKTAGYEKDVASGEATSDDVSDAASPAAVTAAGDDAEEPAMKKQKKVASIGGEHKEGHKNVVDGRKVYALFGWSGDMVAALEKVQKDNDLPILRMETDGKTRVGYMHTAGYSHRQLYSSTTGIACTYHGMMLHQLSRDVLIGKSTAVDLHLYI